MSLLALAASFAHGAESAEAHTHLRVEGSRVLINVPDAQLRFRIGDRLLLIQRNQHYLIGLHMARQGSSLVAVPRLTRNDDATAWISNDHVVSFGSPTATVRGEFFFSKDELLPIFEESDNAYVVEVARYNQRVQMQVPKGTPGMRAVRIAPKELPAADLVHHAANVKSVPSPSAQPASPPSRRAPTAPGAASITNMHPIASIAIAEPRKDEVRPQTPIQAEPPTPPPPAPQTVSGAPQPTVAALTTSAPSEQPAPPARAEAATGESVAPPPPQPKPAPIAENQMEGESAPEPESWARTVRFLDRNNVVLQLLLLAVITQAFFLVRLKRKAQRRIEPAPSAPPPPIAPLSVPATSVNSYTTIGQSVLEQRWQSGDEDSEGDLQGSIEGFGLGQIVQFCNGSGESGVLAVRSSHHSDPLGKLIFRQGQIIDAECEGLQGEAAASHLLTLKSGSFCFTKQEMAFHSQTIRKETMTLLLEAMQAMDERSQSV